MRVCIVTPGKTTLSETFIRLHIECLPHEVIHIHGHQLDYQQNGRSLRDRQAGSRSTTHDRLLNLLPRYAEFRLRKRFFAKPTDLEIVSSFLRDQKVDVVLAEYGTAGMFVAEVCETTQTPLVVHFHGADVTKRSYIEGVGEAYRNMFRIADAAIAVSARMRDDLIALGCPPDKITITPCGPNESFFSCKPDYQSNEVVAVGRLTGKKAPHLAIVAFQQAWKQNRDLRLTLIGDGELLGVCKDLIQALDLAHCVTLAGPQTPEQVRERFNRSFLFIQHSVEADDGDCEGTPVAVLEAGAAGLPLVATRHAGIPDVVVEDETGFLVDERDVNKMAEKILLVATDRLLAENMGQRARRHVAENFSIKHHLGTIDRVLHNVQDRAKPSA